MAKIGKSSDFRRVHAGAVYVIPSASQLRFFFLDRELAELNTGGDGQPATVQESPSVQAEIIVERPLAEWMWKYLNEYFKPEEVRKE